MSDKGAKKVFDPLDMSNYSLEKFKEIKAGIWMERIKFIGMPLAILLFLFFHLQWVGPIEMFDTQTKVPPANCYSATGIFLASGAVADGGDSELSDLAYRGCHGDPDRHNEDASCVCHAG